ncbi:dihydropteroate synthase [Varunaivibrio sulfuroxidans]|uniref:Dihydropteroate synthase n=1 Tax=Varunaivibrio sulfuroxidans TaxID=1773489 RepID=A0A4R3JBY2_9PROT|nr:dihydropteroate synthase [Varunaivibrio sulfuroxidans]TCS63157.1 dihydropteroate synthase [Varunaivibrio sulfuroxidans]WES31780.1 dihydropteroate synthase [Varunaivibrio sulfuroxidans]
MTHNVHDTFAGLTLRRPLLMGIVNVTPDSFSDGGEAFDRAAAIARGRALTAQGADIIDIGGESTRPGAQPVTIDEECARVVPVIETLSAEGIVVSVDTRHSLVMAEAARAGARIINDVSGLEGDGDALRVAAQSGTDIVLMHMRGEPGTMQKAPHYVDVCAEVLGYLEARVAACVAAGIAREKIALDPGIGFGKTDAHNLTLIAGLERFSALGLPILLGVSRKSFIGRIAGVDDPKARLGGSLAAALFGIARGAAIVRVHDVAQTRQAVDIWCALAESSS